MKCEACGDDCRCEEDTSEHGAAPGGAEGEDLSEQMFQASLEAAAGKEVPRAGGEPAIAVCDPVVAGPEAILEARDSWRGEVAARLQRYQARRKPKPPRYPSLLLPFDPPEAVMTAGSQMVSREAVARVVEVNAAPQPIEELIVPARILAFPRSSVVPPAPMQELADPVPNRPRILEAPQTPSLPPALGGITMEARARDEGKSREEDLQVEPASILRRLVAAAVDVFFVASASAMFGAIFWWIVGFRPPMLQLSGLSVGLPMTLWAAYQYLLVVHSGHTPGLWLARLHLASLNGSSVTRSKRRWRVLASFLSAASLGLGYLWVLIEQDSLAWHDRMTGTCLRVKPRPTLQ